jgi:AraC-like DNA-binding protein
VHKTSRAENVPDVQSSPSGVLTVDVAGSRILFVGRGLRTLPHHHYTASVTLALEHPFHVRIPGSTHVQSAHCMVAEPNAAHALDAGDGLVLNIQLDPEAEEHAQLTSAALGGRAIALYDGEQVAALKESVACIALNSPLDCEGLWACVVNHFGAMGPPRTIDSRVSHVLDRLKRAFPDAPSAATLAAEVGLSEGRLIRMFGNEMGVPLRRYVLWLRLRQAMFQRLLGRNLTPAAHAAGFADSAHFARVFRDMFGIAPSRLLCSEAVLVHAHLPTNGLRGPHAREDLARFQQYLRGGLPP